MPGQTNPVYLQEYNPLQNQLINSPQGNKKG